MLYFVVQNSSRIFPTHQELSSIKISLQLLRNCILSSEVFLTCPAYLTNRLLLCCSCVVVHRRCDSFFATCCFSLLALETINWYCYGNSLLTVQDKQVSVVAGTAADANRVAYVKTVRPTSMDADDEPPTSEPQMGHTQPRYTNEVPHATVSLYSVLELWNSNLGFQMYWGIGGTQVVREYVAVWSVPFTIRQFKQTETCAVCVKMHRSDNILLQME